MSEPHVLTGLIAKRAEIVGKIEHLQDQLRQLVVDLDHIDASIHIKCRAQFSPVHPAPKPLGVVRRRVSDGVHHLMLGLLLRKVGQRLTKSRQRGLVCR
jgi:hypothetical protein